MLTRYLQMTKRYNAEAQLAQQQQQSKDLIELSYVFEERKTKLRRRWHVQEETWKMLKETEGHDIAWPVAPVQWP